MQNLLNANIKCQILKQNVCREEKKPDLKLFIKFHPESIENFTQIRLIAWSLSDMKTKQKSTSHKTLYNIS